MKLRENPAMKALAFIAAVAAFAATAIIGWYQLVNYDALWNPDYDAGDGYSIYYQEREDEEDLQWYIRLYQRQQAGEELSLYEEQTLARLAQELSAEETNLRWQLLSKDRQVLAGNTQDTLPAQALGLYWTYFEPWTPEYGVEHLVEEPWEYAAASAVNVTDATNVVCTDNWQQLLQLYSRANGGDADAAQEAAELGFDLSQVNPDTVFLNADGTGDLILMEAYDGAYLFGPSLNAVQQANQLGYQYLPGEGWAYTQEASQPLDLILWLDSSFPVDDEIGRASCRERV